MTNTEAIVAHYEGAHRPLYHSRSKELAVLIEYHSHWGRTITEADFDEAIAILFGDGCEYEWSED